MSYDCYMVTPRCEACGSHGTSEEIGNMTSNVSGMWTKALGGVRLRDLDGKTGADLIPLLEAAASHIRHPDNRAAYVAMEPGNGWGSHDGAADCLEKILRACRQNPRATFQVSS